MSLDKKVLKELMSILTQLTESSSCSGSGSGRPGRCISSLNHVAVAGQDDLSLLNWRTHVMDGLICNKENIFIRSVGRPSMLC